MNSSVVQSAIDAYMQGQSEVLRASSAGISSDKPLGKALQALAAVTEAAAGQGDRATCLAFIEQALRRPPPAADVHICLLDAAYRCRASTNDTTGLMRIYQRMLACLPQAEALVARALVHRKGLQAALSDHDLIQAQHCIRQVLEDPSLDAASDLCHDWRAEEVEIRIANHDFANLDEDLAQLERNWNSEQARKRIHQLRQEFFFQLGQPSQALAYQARLERDPPPRHPMDIFYNAAALIDLGRDAEAQPLLHALRHEDFPGITTGLILAKSLALRQAILRRDSETAQALLHSAPHLETDSSHGLGFEGLLEHHLFLALWSGWSDQAESLLRLLDRHLNRSDLHLEWTRLHLLQGEEEGAVAHFSRLLSKNHPQLVEQRMRLAPELQPWQIARLYHATCQFQTSGNAHIRPLPRIVTPALPEAEAGPLVGRSAAMQAVREQLVLYGPLQQAVLIIGETGTGKELVARELHRLGRQPKAPFLAINCAAIPDSLAEAELFGHLRGAFTGAVTDHPGLLASIGQGSLFLDEVDSLSLRLQALLLRVLETGDYLQIGGRTPLHTSARFLFASNRSLEELVASGLFRRDLYYRLQGFTVHLPPLRERRDDLPDLCRHLMSRCGGQELQLDPSLLTAFNNHSWPGNVRELRNEIERMVLLRGDQRILTSADCSLGHTPTTTPNTRASDHLATGATPMNIPGPPRARDRRRQLLDLFATTSQVYREDVVRSIGCSPNTATKDLAALERAGFIRRVCTSANLRTSYFVRCGHSQEADA